jgi:uncharacterized protein (AIM24 family)
MSTFDLTGPQSSLDRFFAETGARQSPESSFECESMRTLRIDVDGDVWLKPGVAIAHRGALHFERRHTLGAHSLTDAVLRETAPIVRATGKGQLYCARHGSHVRVVRLGGESIVIAWEELLAFESRLAFETSLVVNGIGIAAGGLVVVRLSGHGAFALATHGQPLTLPVTPGQPIMTDPHATLAWSDTLTPTLRTNVSWRSLIAHGGGEAVQMRFEGTGFVVVQPFEDRSRIQLNAKPLKRLAALLSA